MEEKLKQIIEEHEKLVSEYQIQNDIRFEKMRFLQEHHFEHELAHERLVRQSALSILLDYRKAIEELRALLNAWNS